jgi:hypothetical protein
MVIYSDVISKPRFTKVFQTLIEILTKSESTCHFLLIRIENVNCCFGRGAVLNQQCYH